jgi:hypothetical protein
MIGEATERIILELTVVEFTFYVGPVSLRRVRDDL